MQSRNTGAPADLRFGIKDFTYSDLYKPDRLKELSDIFDFQVAAANPELFASWDDYRQNPAKPRTAVEVSALLVAMADHVSRFIADLFNIQNEVADLAARTADQNPVFRFKIDFVRRGVLPALKKMTPPADPVQLESDVELLRRAANGSNLSDSELATAVAATKLLEAERAFGDKGTADERER